MKKTLVRNLSANTLQLVTNQLFGVLIFYVLSVNLDKNSFGQLNLALAVLLSVFNILSLGIDQVIVKKVAHGDNAESLLSLYSFHVILTGLSFYGILLLGKVFFNGDDGLYRLILFVGIGKLMIFLSTPLKQVANGMERFSLLSCMLVISNIVRGLALVILALLHQISIGAIIWVFIVGDTLELLTTIVIFKRRLKVPVIPRWHKTEYFSLLRQSLPQVGVVLITSALARFDWLFIGFMVSAIKLAEYSFAYKIFEISTLPLLAIAPLLIPRFTKLFKSNDHRETDLKLLIRIEVIIAAFTGLLLNMIWNPIVDMVTNGKYGVVNTSTIFILSICLPLMYLNNFFWTIFFVQNRLKMIFTSFLITLCVNIGGDLILIPLYKNEGAAIAFLIACLAQFGYYLAKNKIAELTSSVYNLLFCTASALLSGFTAKAFIPNSWMAGLASVVFYGFLLIITKQIKFNDRQKLTVILKST